MTHVLYFDHSFFKPAATAYQDSPVRCLSEVSFLGLHTNYLHRRTDLAAMCLVKTFNKESHLKLFLTCTEMQI